MRAIYFAVALSFIVLFTACGSGGGSGPQVHLDPIVHVPEPQAPQGTEAPEPEENQEPKGSEASPSLSDVVGTNQNPPPPPPVILGNFDDNQNELGFKLSTAGPTNAGAVYTVSNLDPGEFCDQNRLGVWATVDGGGDGAGALFTTTVLNDCNNCNIDEISLAGETSHSRPEPIEAEKPNFTSSSPFTASYSGTIRGFDLTNVEFSGDMHVEYRYWTYMEAEHPLNQPGKPLDPRRREKSVIQGTASNLTGASFSSSTLEWTADISPQGITRIDRDEYGDIGGTAFGGIFYGLDDEEHLGLAGWVWQDIPQGVDRAVWGTLRDD